MANKTLFGGNRGTSAPAATTTNSAGGLAYSFTPEHALAQLATTGTFNDTFYTKAEDQLKALKEAADQVSPDFLAKCAIYAREKGYMKDMPAALAVILSQRDSVLLDKVFDRVIDNGKQIRNFVQMCRSGALGRRSLGSGPKRLVRRKLASMSDYSVFRASVGNDPSLADVIKMVHPKPESKSREALYAYLIGKDYDPSLLPDIVKQYEAWKRGEGQGEVPNVDFRMLTSLPLGTAEWKQIALKGGWHQTRMNLNTYLRHGVLADSKVVDALAAKLTDTTEIQNARAFPYQLLAAYLFTDGALDVRLRNALQDAMEKATYNVPSYDGNVAVVVDVSGSMTWGSVTGQRKGATSKVRPIDVAALVGATVLRKNKNAIVLPVDTSVHSTNAINPHDSIVTNAQKLASYGGGGTNLSAALRHLEQSGRNTDLIIMVSDNESWVDSAGRHGYRGTATMEIFNRMRRKNRNLKMVCIDTAPGGSSQAPQSDKNILNLGGFSDNVWTTIKHFSSQEGPDQWVEEIKAISLD